MPTVSPLIDTPPITRSPARFDRRRTRRSARGALLVVGVVVSSLVGASSAASAAPIGQSTSSCDARGVASHLVAAGDTWFGIAEQSKVSVRSLVAANDVTVDYVLHPGDMVCLPAGATPSSRCSPSNAPTYAVVSGDTWWDIADRAGVSMSTLLSTNNASQDRVIRPGEAVCLPPGTSVVSTASATASTGASGARRSAGGAASLDALPMRGPCWFSDDWGDPRGGSRRHEGTDLFAAPGSYVYAVVDGTLTRRAWDQPGLRAGNAWWLTAADGSGTYYFYAHLADFAPELSVGSRVSAGQIIGFMGNTGNSAFPHLHFEIHPNGGGAVNPYPLLSQTGGCKTGEQYRQPGGWIPD
jgi:murein DD-endopeptidase MepM/ murein hydrolase activator NlpD